MKQLSNQISSRSSFAKTKRMFLASAALGALALTFLIPAQPARAENGGNERFDSLVGAWMMEVGAPPGPTFTALETFSAGGGSVESNNGPAGHGPGSGHGSWVRTGNRQFLSTLLRLLYDASGNYTGTVKVRRTITVNPNGNEFTGRDNVDLFDTAGNRLPIDIPPATFHATRIVAEPLTR